jgi:putative DNA primase/helicase
MYKNHKENPMSTDALPSPIRPRSAVPISTPVTVELADVVRQKIRWLWPGRIPLGKLTLLAGDPELGKSFLTVDMAARVTRGLPWPDQAENLSGSVIFLNAEDELDDTVCPRLEKAGADLAKCSALTAVCSPADGLTHPLCLTRDLAAVRAMLLAKPDCRLLVIDPISSYMGHVDSNSNADVRSLLYPLAQLAAEFQVAVVAVTHLNKKGTGRAIYRAMGSLAFVAAARSAWIVVCDPQDEARHLLLQMKNNLAEKSTGLAYRFQAESKQSIATIAWEPNPIEHSLDEVLGTFSAAAQAHRNNENYADTWLRERLEEGPKKRDALFLSVLRPAGMSDQQLYRSAQRLGVIKTKQGVSSDSWLWSLPEHAEHLQAQVAAAKQREVG